MDHIFNELADISEQDMTLAYQILNYDYSDAEFGELDLLDNIENIDLKLSCINHIIPQVDHQSKQLYFLKAYGLISNTPLEYRETEVFRLLNSLIDNKTKSFSEVEPLLNFMVDMTLTLTNPAYRTVLYLRMQNYVLAVEDKVNEVPEILDSIQVTINLQRREFRNLSDIDLKLTINLLLKYSKLSTHARDWRIVYSLSERFKNKEFRLDAYKQYALLVEEYSRLRNVSPEWFYPPEIEIPLRSRHKT